MTSPSGLSTPVSLSPNQILRDKTLKRMKFIHFTNKWKCYGPREGLFCFVLFCLKWAFAPILFHWLKFNQLKFLSTIHFNLLKGKICLYRENWIWLYRWDTLSLAYSPSKEDLFFVLHVETIQSEFTVQIIFQGASIKTVMEMENQEK